VINHYRSQLVSTPLQLKLYFAQLNYALLFKNNTLTHMPRGGKKMNKIYQCPTSKVQCPIFTLTRIPAAGTKPDENSRQKPIANSQYPIFALTNRLILYYKLRSNTLVINIRCLKKLKTPTLH
jgi:hypothetical protein